MNEPFILPVNYQGTEHKFKARFERYGYTHRIVVLIDDRTYTFEPDEGGNYRAISNPDQTMPINSMSIPLLQAIAEKLAKLSA